MGKCSSLLSLSETDIFEKKCGIVNGEIGSQLVANIYRVVSEVAAVAYFEFKL